MAEIIYRNARDETRKETRVEKERADRLALENQILRGEVWSSQEVMNELEKGFSAIKAEILRSDLDPAKQDELLKTLVSIKKNVSSRAPRMKSLGRPKG